MAEKKQMSREGYEKLEQELNYLITVRRAEVAQKLKEARSFGDLSENAEYDEAKNEQGILEATIAEMESIIANGCHAIWDGYRSQIITTCKSILPN